MARLIPPSYQHSSVYVHREDNGAAGGMDEAYQQNGKAEYVLESD